MASLCSAMEVVTGTSLTALTEAALKHLSSGSTALEYKVYPNKQDLPEDLHQAGTNGDQTNQRSFLHLIGLNSFSQLLWCSRKLSSSMLAAAGLHEPKDQGGARHVGADGCKPKRQGTACSSADGELPILGCTRGNHRDSGPCGGDKNAWGHTGMLLQSVALLALQHGLGTAMLEAWGNLGSCATWMHGDLLRKWCGVAIGYPDQSSKLSDMPTERRKLQEFCRFFVGSDAWQRNQPSVKLHGATDRMRERVMASAAGLRGQKNLSTKLVPVPMDHFDFL
eukprot:Skav215447  [mRNA]  locus=scaffold2193:55512:58356:- [translate_table: standard]